MVLVYSQARLLVLTSSFLILEGYNSMAIKYNPGYERLVQLVQQGGPQALSAIKQSRQSRKGYMSPINVSMIEEDGDSDTSLEVKLYNRFKGVQESNKFLNNIRKDKLTEDIDAPVTKASFSGKSDNLISFVASFEKFSATPYDDFKQTSIGYGSKATSKDQRLTEAEAKNLLKRDLNNARNIVLKMKKDSGYDWSKNQVDALTSFTHNLGAGNFKKLTENGTRGDEEISDMLLEYKYAGGKVREGLVKRREAELKLFNEGYTNEDN